MNRTAEPEIRKPQGDRRQLRTRRALHEGLLKLLKTKSIEEITVRDLADESLVGYNTFFRHYASKAELLEDCADEVVSRLLDRALPVLVNAGLEQASLALCEYVFEERAVWNALLASGAGSVLEEALTRRAMERNVRSRDHAWLPLELGAIVGVGVTVDIVRWWLKAPDRHSPKEVSEFITRLAIAPTMLGHRAEKVAAPASEGRPRRRGLVTKKSGR